MSDKKKIIIVDLDGTLCDCDHRVHYLHQSPKDWKSFYENMDRDNLNAWCKEIMETFDTRDVSSVLVTGRDEKYRDMTLDWLKKYNISFQKLYMREINDHRQDSLIKKDIYEKYIKEDHEVLFVLDDRKSVVKMWRDIGLTCLQCDWGEF